MKEAGKTWEHYSPPQKGLNPQCVFPSQAPKRQGTACSVLYSACRNQPTQSGYSPLGASDKPSVTARGFFIKPKLKSTLP